MNSVLFKSSFNYLKKNLFQTLLTVLGIALGVTIAVSIDLAIHSSKLAFKLSNARVVGKATHHIIAKSGGAFKQEIYSRLKTDLGLSQAAPVIESYLPVVNEFGKSIATLKLLGTDAFAEKAFRASNYQVELNEDKDYFGSDFQGLISKQTLSKLNSKQALKLRAGNLIKEVQIAGLLKSENPSSLDNLLITDISDAQDILELEDKINKIDLIANENNQFMTSKGFISLEFLQNYLGAQLEIVRSDTNSKSSENITKSFNINLTALSFLALIVAAFLIFNAMSFSVVQRRKLFAILRSLGASRNQVFGIVIGESIFLAIIGTALGLALGILLGKILVGLIIQTINDLYFVVELSKLKISSLSLIKGTVLGIVASIFAALVPAYDASKTSALIALGRSSQESSSEKFIRLLFILGVLLIAASYAALNINIEIFASEIWTSFFALFLLILGFAFICPLIIQFLCSFFLAGLGLLKKAQSSSYGLGLGIMAISSIRSQISRTGIAIVTLMIALSISIALDITIRSFRNTVIDWLNGSLQADIYISSPRLVANKDDKAMNLELIKEIKSFANPYTHRYLGYRNILVESKFGEALLVSVESYPEVKEMMNIKDSSVDFWQAFASPEKQALIISEPFAYKSKLKVGDSFELKTALGLRMFKVAAINYDYGSDQGVIMMSRAAYAKYFADSNISSLAIMLKDKYKDTAEDIIQKLNNKVASQYEIIIRSNKKLLDYSIQIFDRTFRVTYVLKFISMFVAFIAVFSTFMALQLERLKEFATLRAIGLRPSDLTRILIIQTSVMGLLAAVLAIPLGIIQAYILIYFVNLRSFGWSLNFQIEQGFIYEAIVFAVIASLLAIIIPSIQNFRLKPAEVLRGE